VENNIDLRMVYHPIRKKIMDKFKEVQNLIASVEADVTKFYDGGNAAAGTRVRKAMQDLKVLAQDIRAEVTEKKNSAK
jgi:hypothetical protein